MYSVVHTHTCIYTYPTHKNNCKIILGTARWWLRAPAVCSSSSPGFDFQHPYGDLQSSVTLVPGDLMPSWPPCVPEMHMVQTCMQIIHTHKAGARALKCEYWELGSGSCALLLTALYSMSVM